MPKTPSLILHILVLLVCCWLCVSQTRAQQLQFDHLTEEDGLSFDGITCITQDSRGFMWIGTLDGLNRYDGNRFKVYKANPDNPAGLRSNSIYAIYEDQTDTLWVGTYGGLHQYDRDRDAFIIFQFAADSSQNVSKSYHIASIGEDHHNNLWIGTFASGLIKFNREFKELTHYQHDPQNPYSLSSNSIFFTSIYVDRSGTHWIATEDGLNRFDAASERFFHYRHDPKNPYSISHNRISGVFEDSWGILWIATAEGLDRFERETESFRRYRHEPGNPYNLSSNTVNSICEDRSGNLWIGTLQGGISRFDRETNTFRHFQHNPFNPHSLSYDKVVVLYEDRTGVLWIGTQGGGINLLNPQKNRFSHYRHQPDDPNSLSHKTVLSLWEDRAADRSGSRAGGLWIGTEGGGLSYLQWDSRGRETFTHFRHDPANPRSLSSDVVNAIYEDRSGRLWIGTQDGLNLFDEKHQTFYRYRHGPDDPYSLSQNNIKTIYEDRSGGLWFGTKAGGINKLTIAGEPGATTSTSDLRKEQRNREEAGKVSFPPRLKFERIRHDPDDPGSLSDDWIQKIYQDHSQTVWIATSIGLNKFDRENQTFTRYFHDPQNPVSISNDAVYIIFEDRRQRLWVGANKGLNRFDRESKTFIRYSKKDGLANDVITDIAEDDAGNLWIATFGGVSKFDPAVERFKSFDVHDGLQSSAFFACLKRANGELVFGGDQGLLIFNSQGIHDNPHVPPVVLTDFRIFNRPVAIGAESPLRRAISEAREIHLSHRETFFSFEFAVLDYNAPGKNRYAYKLDGFDRDWVNPGERRFASYTNVPPGEYTFRVKGSNNDGLWNKEGAAVKIIIAPPPWKTWWAYLLYAITFLGIIYTLRRYELNRQRLKYGLELEKVEAEKLKELDRLKSRFFANISHEFRTPLTLIKGPIEKWLPKIKDPEMRQDFEITQRNSNRLLQLINQLLDLSKLESGRMKLEARPENIVELVRWVTMSFESLAKRNGIDLKIESSEEEIIVYVDRDKVEKILTNLLTNAFKFTTKGEIQVAVSSSSRPSLLLPTAAATRRLTAEYVEITISDTGIGISEKMLPHIFDRFYQVDSSATREGEGSGIGLALTKELVELHKGDISVASEVGKGTLFTILLPIGKEHLKPEEIEEHGAWSEECEAKNEDLIVHSDQEMSNIEYQISNIEVQESGIEHPVSSIEHLPKGQSPNHQITKSPNILIVEDNPDVRTYIRSYLKEKHQIIEAGDGEEGWEKALEKIPDLIISDVMMPKMDGFQLCEKLKTDERTSHIPVILLTARASGESKVEGLETGADDYLTKPFDAKELLVRIKNLIEQRQRLREKFHQEITVQPGDITVTSVDQKFLERAMEVVERHLPDEDFSIEQFSEEMAISRIHLNRKLQAITGQTTRDFIRTLRLKRAAQLLSQKSGTVSEIAYAVGFNNLSYFAKCFKKQFGQLPSEYRDELS